MAKPDAVVEIRIRPEEIAKVKELFEAAADALVWFDGRTAVTERVRDRLAAALSAFSKGD